jgi:two-component system sensor histidine kinase UhpB
MNSLCINVLLIEDVPGDAWLVQAGLKGTSNPAYRVEWMDCLSRGLARLTEGGIDVILLDLGLPDSQGLASLAAIHALAPAVPVVVLSGADDEQLAVDAVQAGAQDFLVKAHASRHLLPRALRYAIERKRDEMALRETAERLRLAMHAVSEAIWEYNPASGAARWNATYAENFAWPPEAGDPAQWWIDSIHPGDRERVSSSLRDALEGRGESWTAQYRFRRADGAWARVRDRAGIARDESGKPTRVVGAMLDVTLEERAKEELEESNRRLRQLSRDLLRSQDYERRRIARELHDSTSQLLAALSINLSRLREPGLKPDRRSQALSEATELAAACSAEIRTITYLLHSPLLDDVGLVSALRSYAQGFSQRTGIQVELEIPPDFGRLGRDQEGALFRVVQEALANVHKHSGSSTAVIRLERDPGEVRLALQDRGRGLPAGLQRQGDGLVCFGVGIPGMRERAEQLGGRLDLASNDTGTRVTVTLPLVQANEEDANPAGR